MTMKILLVEDNALLGTSLKQGLEESGCLVDWARDGQEGLFLAEQSHYHILLLDQMLPRLSGLELLASLRLKKITIPSIMISARSSLDERIQGLDAGADDYIAKPFELRELLARLRALFRRSHSQSASTISYGPLTLDPHARQVLLHEAPMELTAKEFDLLEIFVQKPEAILSRAQIAGLMYPYEDEPESNSVDVLLARLRRKLQGSTLEIATVRGRGFVLRIENTATQP